MSAKSRLRKLSGRWPGEGGSEEKFKVQNPKFKVVKL